MTIVAITIKNATGMGKENQTAVIPPKCLHVSVCAYMCECVCVHACMRACAHMHQCMHVYAHARMRVCAFAYCFVKA